MSEYLLENFEGFYNASMGITLTIFLNLLALYSPFPIIINEYHKSFLHVNVKDLVYVVIE